MKIFSKFYQQILTLANNTYAPYYLALLSFFESFILPYPPPDVLLAPMSLKQPQNAYKFALNCTIFSILGGIVGYSLGAFSLEFITPFLERTNSLDKLVLIQNWFAEYGILVVALAGFSPIPYKIFTLGAGISSMAFLPFVIISFAARGLRFFLVTFLVKKFGNQCDIWLKKYVDRLGYALIFITIMIIWYV
jgi:membrane protein YqaA with SNARE-associated domain